jgi:hypothetical protein
LNLTKSFIFQIFMKAFSGMKKWIDVWREIDDIAGIHISSKAERDGKRVQIQPPTYKLDARRILLSMLSILLSSLTPKGNSER